MGHQPPNDHEPVPTPPIEPRVIPKSAGLDARLPAPLAKHLERLVADPPIETVADWIATVRDQTGGGGIDIGDLCHTDAVTGHWAEVGGTRYDFRCFYDAVILAAFHDDPVTIRTESPAGTVIDAQAAGTEALTVDPASAVFSFGVASDVTPPDGAPTHESVYRAVCPYVQAFPTTSAYHDWRRTVPATTVAMPLADATEMAAALVE